MYVMSAPKCSFGQAPCLKGMNFTMYKCDQEPLVVIADLILNDQQKWNNEWKWPQS